MRRRARRRRAEPAPARPAHAGEFRALARAVGPPSALLAEDRHVDRDAAPLQVVVEARHESGSDEAAGDPALLVEALLLEEEDVLHGDDVALHARHLRDRGHPAAAVAESLLLHDQMDGARDLLADGADGQI